MLFPGFGPMYALHGKQVFPVFPIKWCHEGTQIFSTKELHIWAPLWCHLMGKTSFPWSAHSKPSISITLVTLFFLLKSVKLMVIVPHLTPKKHLYIYLHHHQCDQIGQLLKVLGTIFCYKSSWKFGVFRVTYLKFFTF